MKLKRFCSPILVTGIIMGLSAAAAQAFFRVQPPEAYGICLIGHPRDMVNWLLDNFLHTDWPISEVSYLFPVFTVFGVLVGSLIAAYKNKELNFRSGPVRSKFFAFMFGFLVVNFGLMWGSCPIRTGLLVSYGNVLAIIVLVAITVGVLLACIYIRFRIKKEII